MKKILFPLLAIGVMMVSCIEDKGNHLTQIFSPNGIGILFADQTLDTLKYHTTEKHKLITSADWLEADDDIISSIKFQEETVYGLEILIRFEPNTTGEPRTGSVKIDAGDYSTGAYFTQLPYLKVTRPARIINGNTLEVIQYGPLADSAFVTVDSISFTTYDAWTLSTGKWATPEQWNGPAGTHTVRLNLQPYESTEADRMDTLLLTSNGVTDSIPLLQYKKRVKTN